MFLSGGARPKLSSNEKRLRKEARNKKSPLKKIEKVKKELLKIAKAAEQQKKKLEKEQKKAEKEQKKAEKEQKKVEKEKKKLEKEQKKAEKEQKKAEKKQKKAEKEQKKAEKEQKKAEQEKKKAYTNKKPKPEINMGSLSSFKTLYDVLEIDSTATNEQIKKAYRILALKYHPDKNPGNIEAERRTKSLNEAYKILTTPRYKQYYDSLMKVNMPLKKKLSLLQTLIRVGKL